MNKRNKREQTRRFNWGIVPKCVNQKDVKLRTGMVIAACLAKKGTGRNNFICAHKGIEPQCRFYKSKHKWGRGLSEIVSELI